MNLVGAGLDGGLNDGAAGAAELGRGGGGVDAEFLGAVEIGEELERVDEGFVVVDAVEDEVVGLRAETVGGKRAAAGGAVAEGFRVAVDAGSGVAVVAAGDAGGEQGEAGEVPAVEGELGDLAAFDGFTDGGGVGVDQGRGAGDFNDGGLSRRGRA